jgi:hypothetical protein
MMPAQISNFVVGKNQRGRWTAVAADRRSGGFFVSREAALRYATLETGRRPGAVRETTSPVQLTSSRLGGEGPPVERRHDSRTSEDASRSQAHATKSLGGKGWFLLDVGIAMGFVLLCVAAGAALS